MEKSFRKDVLEKCWSCGEGIDKDDNCFCDRQSLKIRDLSERIKALEEGKLPHWFLAQGLTDLDKVAKYIMQLQAALERMTAYYEAAIQGIVTDNSDDVLKQARDATGVK